MATIRNVVVRLGVSERGFSRGFRRATRDVERFQRDANGRLHDLNGRFVAEGRAAGEGYGRSFRTSALKSLGKLTKLTKGFKVMVKTAAAVGALSALAGSAAVATSAVLQLAVALAPAAGALAGIPGAIGLAAAAIGTLKLALVGVGDAFKFAMGKDMEAFKGAIKDLSPSARGVAIELHKVRPALLGIQKAAQEGLFRPLLGQLTATAKVLKGPLKTAFHDLGRQIGGAGAQVAIFARQARTVAAIKAIFFDATQATAMLRNAIEPLLAGFRDLARTGAGFLTTLTPGITRAAMAFGQWLSQIARSGQAVQWMQGALDLLTQLGRILRNVGSIALSVFRAAGQAGGGLLGTIERLTGQFAAFLKSTEGVRTLRAIFSGIGQIGKALGPVIIAIAKGLGQIAPAIGRIAVMVGPILTKAINALAPALAALEPGITALIDGLGGAIAVLAPALVPVARALSQVAAGLAPILPALGTLIAMLAEGLAAHIQRMLPVLPTVVDAIIQLGYALGGALLDVLKEISPYLPELVVSFSDLLVALIPLIPPFTDLVIAITPLIPVITDVINLITQLTNSVMPVLTYALYSQKVATELLVDVTKKAWGYIRDFISDRIDNLKSAIGWFGDLPAKFGKWFGGARDGASRKLSDLVGIIKGVPGQILRALGDTGNLLWNAGKSIMVGLANGVLSQFDRLMNLFRDITRRIPQVKGPLSKDKTLLNPAGTAIMGGLISSIAAQIPALRAVLGTVTSTITGPTGPGLAVAGAPQPRGALQAGGTQAPPIDYQRLAAALVAAMKAGGLGSIQLDGQVLTDVVSRRQGQSTALRRRSG